MANGHLQVTAIANPKTPRVKVADAFGNRWMIQCSKDKSGALSYIAKGARGTSWIWTNAKSGAKLFVTRGEASRYAADFVAPYMDRRNGPLELVAVTYGSARAEVSGNKNPTFGKRKTGTPKTAKKKAAPKFGRKKVAGRANPTRANTAPKMFIVRATLRDPKNALKYSRSLFYTGNSFNTDRRFAARYSDARTADNMLNYIEDEFAAAISDFNLDVIQA